MTGSPARQPHPSALARRYEAYAAKFLAETSCAEPPRPTEPTDAALARIVSAPTVGRPARPEEYDEIRAVLKNWPTNDTLDC